MSSLNFDNDSNSESSALLYQNQNDTSSLPEYDDFLARDNIFDYNPNSQNSFENINTLINAASTNFSQNEYNINSSKEENETIDDRRYYIEHRITNESNEGQRIANINLNVENNLRSNNLNNNIDENNENNGCKNKKKGRNKKGSDEVGEHTKISPDNIRNKIKTHFFNTFIIFLIKILSLNKSISLKKIQTAFIRVLSKEKNEELFDMKIKDILCEQPISTKYSTFDRYENKKIIDKIYKENKEINVIKILDLTFDELFIIYRRKLNNPEDIEELEKIKAKIDVLGLFGDNYNLKDVEDLIKKQEKNNDEEYIKKIKKACIEYKSWFINKKTRNSN